MTTFVNQPPKTPSVFEHDDGLKPEDLPQIAELFTSEITGSYSWNYVESDRRIRKLYELGKARNWNASVDVDWSPELDRSQAPALRILGDPYAGWEPYDALTEAEQTVFNLHQNAWTLSQFLHGEQGALLVASQLATCAPTHDAKLYAASQLFDEARHVEVLSRYLYSRLGIVYPVNRHLKVLVDKLLTDPRWDLKFIGMQLIIETLALTAFDVQISISRDPVIRQILGLIVRDESRHVAFGVTYMEGLVQSLDAQEIAYRARFALEACRIMRERIVPTDLYEHYASKGFDVVEGSRRFLGAGELDRFRSLLFSRIMPNLKRIGLLTDEVAPAYEALGLLSYADLPSSADVDWTALEAESAPSAPPADLLDSTPLSAS